MATIALTGASGFLGAHYLKHTLATFPEWRQIALVRRTPLGFSGAGIQPMTCDLTRPGSVDLLCSVEPDVVIHMAAAIMEDNARQQNEAMIGHVLEACHKSDAKLVYISSSQVHFSRLNQYALSKIDDEQAVQESGVPFVVLRPAAPYGRLLPDHVPARPQSMHVLVKLIRSLPAVPVIGNGRYTRQPVHVDDLNAAINSFIEGDEFQGRIFDIGGPRAYTMDEIIKILAEIAGKVVLPVHLPKVLFLWASRVVRAFHRDILSTTDCTEQVDNGPIMIALGRESFVPFEEGARCLF
jgi:NADH dehydrogenase